MKLSVYMITCNEEARLARTLAQAAKVADEIVVVDSGSTDETLKIGQRRFTMNGKATAIKSITPKVCAKTILF